jgi:hypothetical protein
MSIFKNCPYSDEECIHEIYSGEPRYSLCNTCSVKSNLSNCDKQDETDKLSDISNERVVKTRLAGNKITICEAIDRGMKCKTLREFADWIYKIWAQYDKDFNWSEIDTYKYSNILDERIDWRHTWVVTAPGGSDNHTYPIAFTNEPFYKLDLNDTDSEYIRNKYPKFLERVDNLRTGYPSHESELYRKEMLKRYGEH